MTGSRMRTAALAILVALASLPHPAGAATPSPKPVKQARPGTTAPAPADKALEVSGTVHDSAGAPLPGWTVILEVGRWEGAPGEPRSEVATRRQAATSGDDGSFRIATRVPLEFNRASVKLARRTKEGGRDVFEVLDTEEVTDRWRSGRAIVVRFVRRAAAPAAAEPGKQPAPPAPAPGAKRDVPPQTSPGFDETSEEAVARSADQRRVLAERGKPERVRTVRRGADQVVEWWYYQSGLVFRFQNGTLVRTREYRPVRPL